MESQDFEAVTYEASVYCNGCCPVDIYSEGVWPVFADSEWDYYPVCDGCGQEHTYMNLTTAREG